MSASPSASASASPYPVGVLWHYETDLISAPDENDNDWYQYFFASLENLEDFILLDMPTYTNAILKVTLTGTSVEVGTFAFGKSVFIGDTQWGLQLGITDYSTKETDEFGVTSIVERVFADRMDCDLFLEHSLVRMVKKLLASVRATPCIWMGSETSTFSELTIVYGFYKNFDIVLQDYGGSICSLEVEGLT